MILLIALILIVGAIISVARSQKKAAQAQIKAAQATRIAEWARARREAGLPADYDRRGPLAKLLGVNKYDM